MAASKHPFGRYQIIDRELRRKEWVKTSELVKIIQNELFINVSPRTINNDMNDMETDPVLGYYAPIEKDLRNKAYRYQDRNYTIRAFGLMESDINALNFYVRALNQYKDYEVFKDFSGAIEKVLDAVNIRKGIKSLEQARTIVQTENAVKPTGSEHIPFIVQALNENKSICFQYLKFGESEAKTVSLEPYLLKEDHHRWYIIGKVKSKPQPTTIYALDRIHDIHLQDATFRPMAFDFETYFLQAFGITVNDTDELVEIVLSFSPQQGNYLRTLPLHISEKVLIDSEEEYRISVYLKPAYEFYAKILSFGDSVTILSPEDVKDTIHECILRMSEKYKK